MKLLVISHFNADPFFNMAFDEWLLYKVLQEEATVCLRLYSWSEGAITFGFNQDPAKAFNTKNLGKTEVIRRITGGRAIYHDRSEITYAIAVSADVVQNGPFKESIVTASSEIAQVLVRFLERVNIKSDFMRNASAQEKDRSFIQKAPCFASYARHEILANDKKVIASAQRRISSAFVQHGAVKISGIQHHPALSMTLDNIMTDSEIPHITKLRFEECYKYFVEEFKSYFESSPQSLQPSASDDIWVKRRQNEIKKNSTAKRYIIKQNS